MDFDPTHTPGPAISITHLPASHAGTASTVGTGVGVEPNQGVTAPPWSPNGQLLKEVATTPSTAIPGPPNVAPGQLGLVPFPGITVPGLHNPGGVLHLIGGPPGVNPGGPINIVGNPSGLPTNNQNPGTTYTKGPSIPELAPAKSTVQAAAGLLNSFLRFHPVSNYFIRQGQ